MTKCSRYLIAPVEMIKCPDAIEEKARDMPLIIHDGVVRPCAWLKAPIGGVYKGICRRDGNLKTLVSNGDRIKSMGIM